MAVELAGFETAPKNSHLTSTSMSKKRGFKSVLLHQSCSGWGQAVAMHLPGMLADSPLLLPVPW